MLPFTVEQFFGVFREYNTAIWPAQVLAYVLGAVAVGLALRPTAHSGRIVSGILAAMWGWTGIVYHWMHFASINPVAVAFAVAFIAQALLLLYIGVIRRRLGFASRSPTQWTVGLLLIAYAMVLYPLIGRWTGHSYPAAPTFGLTPCPLTIFTFGLFLLTAPPLSKWLLMVPLLWSFIGGSAAILLQVPQDLMLPVSGLVGVVMIFVRDGRGSGRHPHVPPSHVQEPSAQAR